VDFPKSPLTTQSGHCADPHRLSRSANRFKRDGRNNTLLPPFVCQVMELTAVEAPMNGIIYIIGLIVVIMAILSFLGLR
jgi:small-conductance mechanosensitive channel